MPARTARPPRTRPGGRLRLGGLPALPQREVLRRTLAARIGIRRRFHVPQALPRELAVRRPARSVEIDITRIIRGRIRVARIDEARDERLHLGDARGRARLVGRREDAQLLVPARELELVAVGESPPLFSARLARRRPCGALALRLTSAVASPQQPRSIGEDLIVDVCNVTHKRDRESAIGEPATPQVVDEGRTQVPDVRR